MPKVSVCIACYNHENYIGEAIESVLNQTFQDFEIIICNNGSTDNSLNVMESYKDKRIKIETIFPNKQSTFAGINCVKRASGKYLALLCSDDLWEKDKLQKQVEYLDNNKETGAVFTRCQPIMPNGKIITKTNNPYHKHFNLLENRPSMKWIRSIWETADHSFCCSSAVIRKSVWNNTGGYDVRLKHIQDMDLWANILTQYDAYILDEKLTKMRYFPKRTNLSAFSVKSSFAIFNECSMLYRQFNKIPTIEKFLEFMPEAKEKFSVLDKKYIPFYTAILTLENCPKIHYKHIALQVLYEFMASEENRTGLKKDLNFTHLDLYKISENHIWIYSQKIFKRIIQMF